MTADDVARDLVERGVAPRAAAACARVTASGRLLEVGGSRDLYFDLASLTKPMTALSLARSGLPLARALGDVAPELAATASGEAALDLLLSHRAGLAAHVALFAPLLSGGTIDRDAAIRRAASARREGCEGPLPAEGFPPLYSDLGYILAGHALSRVARARDAGEAIEALVAAPLSSRGELGTARALAAAGVDLPARAAPTEDVPWRGGVISGRVHDENAWALTGLGGSGHAGMFGTAGAVLRFGCAVLEALGGRGPFADADVGALTRPRPGGDLRAGFDGKSAEGSSAGASFGPRSFGHLGFTGTSLWIDPDAGVVVVLLTNRIHPTRAHTALRAARPAAHEALFRRARLLGAPRGER